MNNWKRVLPKYLLRNKTIVKKGKNVTVKRKLKTLAIIKINLTQLPQYLFNKLKPIYKEGKLSHYYVKDNIYKYVIVPSDVDNSILELKNIIKSYKKDYERMSLLLEIIESSHIEKGWIYLKGKKLYENNN